MVKEVYTGNIGDMFTSHRDESIVQDDDVGFTDEEWLTSGFMVSSDDMDNTYKYIRFNSTVDIKFTDTTMGGSVCINTLPQYTRYADIRSQGLYKSRPKVSVGLMSTDNGMGRYYSEAIDDNSTNVYFEFGVAGFNNILSFLMGAVDYRTSIIANSGRSPFFYDAGNIFGYGALIVAFPILAPALLLSKLVVNVVATMAASNGRFDQYYLKPTMFTYWASVNSIVTMMATELGLILPVFAGNDSKKIGSGMKLDATDVKVMAEMMPGLITESGAVNVHAMVGKHQKLYAKMHESKQAVLEKLSAMNLSEEEFTKHVGAFNAIDNIGDLNDTFVAGIQNTLMGIIGSDKNYTKEKTKDKISFAELLKTLSESGKEIKDALSVAKDGSIDKSIRPQDSETWMEKSYNTTKAVLHEGARYAVFKVDHLQSSTESFSNSVDNVASAETVNNMGDTWRNLKFNTGLEGIPGIGTAVNAVKDVAVGVSSGLTMGATDTVASILSGAKVAVQKKWTSSSVSFPTQTFKMQLVSPSAHPVAQLRNLYIPLACIMAGVLPLATGPRSNTSPYLCSMYIRGRQQINLGMITSLSITRGASNLPFNKQRRPLAIDVTFSVTDFSELISAPTPNGLLSLSSVAYDDEAGLSRYIQALCGRDLYSSTHVLGKAMIKFSRLFQSANLLVTPESMGARVGDSITTSGIFSIFGGNRPMGASEMY